MQLVISVRNARTPHIRSATTAYEGVKTCVSCTAVRSPSGVETCRVCGRFSVCAHTPLYAKQLGREVIFPFFFFILLVRYLIICSSKIEYVILWYVKLVNSFVLEIIFFPLEALLTTSSILGSEYEYYKSVVKRISVINAKESERKWEKKDSGFQSKLWRKKRIPDTLQLHRIIEFRAGGFVS